ncbi:small acidic protein 1 [Chenopodium quinoa]|uniref:small acidic protein 1 n=1 Tax=Chenopodium quinoa TaxID=63459 RepID=UPI000B77A02D|nr:small acidic protein 1 [Chenopodium quinoa]
MKQIPGDYLAELEEQSAAMAMDVDDVDPLEVFGENLMAPDNFKLADADFFNFFSDDFDDTDIN